MRPDASAGHVSAIRNAAWWVRWWARPHQRDARAQAIHTLGLAVRAAFSATEDFEPLLYAIRDALAERD